MPFAALSDDFSDDMWTFSDAAFRLHVEAIVWSNRKLLDMRIPKEDLRQFKNPHPVLIAQLVAARFWQEDGDQFIIVHQFEYQRPRERVLNQRRVNAENAAKRGGRKLPPGRWSNKSLNKSLNESLRESQVAPQISQSKIPENSRKLNESLNESHNEMAGLLSSKHVTAHGVEDPWGSEPAPEVVDPWASSSDSGARDPLAWPTENRAVADRTVLEEKGIRTVAQLMEFDPDLSAPAATKIFEMAFPGQRQPGVHRPAWADSEV